MDYNRNRNIMNLQADLDRNWDLVETTLREEHVERLNKNLIHRGKDDIFFHCGCESDGCGCLRQIEREFVSIFGTVYLSVRHTYNY